MKTYLAFDLAGNIALEVNDQMPGWQSLIEALPNYLHASPPCGDWQQALAPASSPSDEVLIVQRQQSAHP